MVQDRVLNRCHSADLVDDGLLSSRLVLTALVQNLILVDITALFRDRLPSQDVHSDDVMLIESFGPPLRDSILDLIFDHVFVRALRQSLRQRLLMKLIELVVELCDHLLNIGRLFLCVELLEYGHFNVMLLEHTLLNH